MPGTDLALRACASVLRHGPLVRRRGGLVLVDPIVDRLLPVGSASTVVVDDRLCKRSGKKVLGVAWQHDGAANRPKPIGFGNGWVVAGIVVELPFLTRPVVARR
jgi:hypothetical protein